MQNSTFILMKCIMDASTKLLKHVLWIDCYWCNFSDSPGFLHQLLLSLSPVCLPLHISVLHNFHISLL